MNARHRFAAFALVVFTSGCATSGRAPGRDQVDEAIRSRAGVGLRPEESRASLPPDVSLADGLAPGEAVAIALWNSPAFEASLADLGLARADLVEAGLLKNPVLSYLFPLGPKQLEWTLQFAVDALWQRPRRVAAFTLNAQAVGERLVSQGLFFIAEVRQAYVDAVAAKRRVALSSRNAELLVEAAGARASWERTRVVNLIVMLDVNGEGREGFEMGPGISADIPIFARNQGGISRAEAELSRASRSYLAVRVQVVAEVRTALIRYDQAQQAVRIWDDEIVPSLELEERQAEIAYRAGEVALLSLLDASRRLTSGSAASMSSR